MKKIDTNVKVLVDMIERGELLLPEMQRRFVWRASKVRDLLDSIYRGYPTGTILVWETDEAVPTRDIAVAHQAPVFSGSKMLLDGQQRLTSLSAVLRGIPVTVRGRRKPIEILFNLEHPEGPPGDVTEVEDEEADSAAKALGDDEIEDTDADEEASDDPTGLESIHRRTFVVASKNLARQSNWVRVSDVFQADSDAALLTRAGVTGFDDPRFAKYSERLARLRRVHRRGRRSRIAAVSAIDRGDASASDVRQRYTAGPQETQRAS